MKTVVAALVATLSFSLSLRAQGGRVIMPAEIGVTTQRGKPFTATARTTLTETLPDGTKKTRTVEDRIARDSKGRIYKEQHLPWTEDATNPIYYVNIYDPVGGRRIHIDPQNHIFMISPVDRQRKNDYDPNEYLTLRARRVGESINNDKLGTQEIAGVKAMGRRVTHTYPAGMFGNPQPFVSVDEWWYSAEMGVDTARRRSDPRSGEQATELLGLTRGEPDPGMFQPPPGYTRQTPPTRH